MQKISNDMEQATAKNSHSVATDAIKSAENVVKGLNVLNFGRINLNNVTVVKKDGTKEKYNVEKVVTAIKKSAARMLKEFTDREIKDICNYVNKAVADMGKETVEILQMHNIVESALQEYAPLVAESYRNYRNYKTDFVSMLDKVYQESQRIMYIGDKENSNADSALVSTKRSLTFNELNKELYLKFFLTTEELEAQREGYIYTIAAKGCYVAPRNAELMREEHLRKIEEHMEAAAQLAAAAEIGREELVAMLEFALEGLK